MLEEPFVGFVDSEFAWCFDRSALVGGSAPGRHLVLVAPGSRDLAQWPAWRLTREALRALEAHAPAAARRAVLDSRVIKEPRAAPSLTPEVARARPSPTTPIPGLGLAGDWTDTGLPATLEGAAQSGHAAAAALDRYLASLPPC